MSSFLRSFRLRQIRIRQPIPSRRQLSITFDLNMRVPYVSDPPPKMGAEQQAIYDRVAARRHPRPLQPLDLALLHNPHVADGWNSFLGAIRTKTSLPDDYARLLFAELRC